MFARKPQTPPPTAAAPRRGVLAGVRGAIANPYVSVGAAAVLFLASATGVIALTGDERAGTPVVRLSLAQVNGASVPGWREALPGESAHPAMGSADLTLSQSPIEIDNGAPAGQAIITMPGGEQLAAPVFAGEPLAQAPLAGFTAPGPGGLLPMIAADGRTPAQVYARPFVANGKPKIALIIGGLGLNAQATRKAIETLPPEVTLSFVPYAEGLQGWIDMARAAGHEVLLEAPMEPIDYPQNDPGPYTLMADGRPEETVRRMEWLMSRATGYFGVTNYLGSRFVASAPAMTVFTNTLRQRGLAFVDDGSAARVGGGVPRASANRIVDDQLAAEAISGQLTALEAEATRGGKALGSGFAYPVTLDVASRWSASLAARGFQLAPASAVMTQR